MDHNLESRPDVLLDSLPIDPPKVTYGGPKASRDSSELFSAAMPGLSRGGALLDLGCGPRDQVAVAAHLGLRYVGIDYTSALADIRADAHCLPFGLETFDSVFSYAVLEHMQDPFVALAEVKRVLVPGGVFFGTVSQGEPFHSSYFHMTAWGVLSVMQKAGLLVEMIWPSRDTLGALADMGRYPRLIRAGLSALDSLHRHVPILSPRKSLRWSDRERGLDRLHRAGSICFLARNGPPGCAPQVISAA